MLIDIQYAIVKINMLFIIIINYKYAIDKMLIIVWIACFR